MDTKEIEQILAILKQNDVTEFELSRGDTHIKLTRSPRHQVSLASSAPVTIEPAIVSAGTGTATPANEDTSTASQASNVNLFRVESPLVGTFYRKPAPDAEPYVTEGMTVKKGDILCIVEAMKLMNEIEATVSGKIEKVLVGDGEVVEFGEVLFLINPSA